MSDDALVRLENLRALNLTPTQLSESVGGRYTYWRDLLAGKKSFGEKAARKIEEKLQLRRGELDDEPQSPRGTWPFALFGQAEWMLLPQAQREDIENSIAGAIQRARLKNGTEHS